MIRGLHSFTSQLNLYPFVTPPRVPLSNRRGKSCTQRIPQNLLILGRNVDECEPLPAARSGRRAQTVMTRGTGLACCEGAGTTVASEPLKEQQIIYGDNQA